MNVQKHLGLGGRRDCGISEGAHSLCISFLRCFTCLKSACQLSMNSDRMSLTAWLIKKDEDFELLRNVELSHFLNCKMKEYCIYMADNISKILNILEVIFKNLRSLKQVILTNV